MTATSFQICQDLVHVYAHARTHVCTHVYAHVCTHFCAHVYAHVYTHVYAHVYAHVCTRVRRRTAEIYPPGGRPITMVFARDLEGTVFTQRF